MTRVGQIKLYKLHKLHASCSPPEHGVRVLPQHLRVDHEARLVHHQRDALVAAGVGAAAPATGTTAGVLVLSRTYSKGGFVCMLG